MLSSRAADIMDLADLTPGERREPMNMAQGVPSKDAAFEGCVSLESIRVCRTRIYKKLGAWRAGRLISMLEVLATATASAG
jgi:FixJ family two-component response regulator